SDGTLNNANGSTNQTGSVTVNRKFGSSDMRIRVRPHSDTYTFTLPYGNDTADVTVDQDGNVTCTIDEIDNPETEFKLTGRRGSALVKAASGQDSRQLKEEIQKILDGE